jgi:hypothetical protein
MKPHDLLTNLEQTLSINIDREQRRHQQGDQNRHCGCWVTLARQVSGFTRKLPSIFQSRSGENSFKMLRVKEQQ